jgi:hypothetical protein
VLAVIGTPIALAHWFIGGGSILVVTNIGREDLRGVSAVLLTEGGSYGQPPKREWPLGAVRPGESVEIELSPSNDANPAIRFTRSDGTSALFRLRIYVGGYPHEVRVNVSNGKIERALEKSRRGSEYREVIWEDEAKRRAEELKWREK